MASLVLSQASTSLLAPSLYGFMAEGATVAASGALWAAAQGITGALGSIAGSVLDRLLFSHDQDYFGPRLNDLTVQTSTEGASLPIVYGTMRLAGNVIWSTGLEEIATTTEQGGGSGGGGGSSTTYSYRTDCAVAVCEGTITGIRRIWADTKLIYDVGDTASVETLMASGRNDIRFYTGSETQLCDTLTQAVTGSNLAYRGTAYVVFENLELADFGNRLPNFSFEVVKSGSITNTTLVSSSIPKNKICSIQVKDNLAKVWVYYGVIAYNNPGYAHLLEYYYYNISSNTFTRKGSFIIYSNDSWQIANTGVSINTDFEDDSVILNYTASFSYSTLITYNNKTNSISAAPVINLPQAGNFCYLDKNYILISTTVAVRIIKRSSLITTSTYVSDTSIYKSGAGIVITMPVYNDISNVYATIGTSATYEYDASFYMDDTYIYISSHGSPYNSDWGRIYKIEKTQILNSGGNFNLTNLVYEDIYPPGLLYGYIYKGYDNSMLFANNNVANSAYISYIWNSFTNLGTFPNITSRGVGILAMQSNNILLAADYQTIHTYKRTNLAKGTQTVKEVVEDISNRVKIPLAKYDYSNLSTEVMRGYNITKPMTAVDALAPITATYKFDIVEEDSKLKSKLYNLATSAKVFNIQEIGGTSI